MLEPAKQRPGKYSEQILIVEDDPVTARVLASMLERSPYRHHIVSTAEEALVTYQHSFFPVVIVDLHLPRSSGDELIQQLNDRTQVPIILVHTVEQDTEKVIETMKLGVYDYLIKPVSERDLFNRLEKALEVFELRQMQKDLEKEREIRVRKQLSWNLWKETLIFRNGDRFDQSLFGNLHTIVSQGKGFGMLVSMVRDIKMMGRHSEAGLVIPESLVDLLAENAHSADQAIQRFQSINRVLRTPPQLHPYSVSEFYEEVEQSLEGLQELAGIKDQSLVLSSGGKDEKNRYVLLEKDVLKEAINELLTNAMKFSQSSSSILILFKPLAETLEVAIVSEPLSMDGVLGIPDTHETAVFEPFYRVGRTVDERYATLDYGLGLTFADKVVRKHGGRIRAFNIRDHLNLEKTGNIRVNVQTELPLVHEKDLDQINLDNPGETVLQPEAEPLAVR